MKRTIRYWVLGAAMLCGSLCGLTAEETVATALYARVGNGYKREKAKDGSFKPEYYALSNGGRIYGTINDHTIDRVTYPEVAEIAMRLLARQNYRYAEDKAQAKLLIVLQWGKTLAFNRSNYSGQVNNVATAKANMQASIDSRDGGAAAAAEVFENEMFKLLMENKTRDQVNENNARVLGYLDDLAETNDIRRWAGGGDRFNDLIDDVEESRYYIVISAYDFHELEKKKRQKLQWQVRVSVRAPGNRFDDSFAAMLKGASKYFGQDSGRLVRGEESKGTVELGDLKFLGEAKEHPEGKAEAGK